MVSADICIALVQNSCAEYRNIETGRKISKVDNYGFKDEKRKLAGKNKEIFDKMIIGIEYLEKVKLIELGKYINLDTGRFVSNIDRFTYKDKELKFVTNDKQKYKQINELFKSCVDKVLKLCPENI